MIPGEEINIENLENLVEHHMAFLIRTVSGFTGKYVSIENDEEFSIALSGFAEAVTKYDPDRGNFLGFAKLVIESRLKTYLAKTNAEPETESLEELCESGRGVSVEEVWEDPDSGSLHEEIILYREELLLFGLTLDRLAENAPKHKDTRATAIQVAERVSKDQPTVEAAYRKKRLPIRMAARVGKVSEKVVKRSKTFILATMIIFVKRFPGLLYWITGSRWTHVS